MFHSNDITDERFGGRIWRKVAFNREFYQVANLHPEGMPLVGGLRNHQGSGAGEEGADLRMLV